MTKKGFEGRNFMFRKEGRAESKEQQINSRRLALLRQIAENIGEDRESREEILDVVRGHEAIPGKGMPWVDTTKEDAKNKREQASLEKDFDWLLKNGFLDEDESKEIGMTQKGREKVEEENN